MPKVTSLGHLGFYVRDMERSVAFYRDILGMQVSDRSPRGAVFMTAQDRLAEITTLPGSGRNDEGNVNVIQQISFHCATLKDVKDFYQLFVDKKVTINRSVVSHGNTVSFTPRILTANSVECLLANGIDVPQPFATDGLNEKRRGNPGAGRTRSSRKG